MDSNQSRKLFYQHASSMAYVDVLKPDGTRGIGSAFHVGEGIFVTARHVVDRTEIVEVRISEPVAIKSKEFFNQFSDVKVSDDRIEEYDKTMREIMGHDPLFKHWLNPLEIEKATRATWVFCRSIDRRHSKVSRRKRLIPKNPKGIS